MSLIDPELAKDLALEISQISLELAQVVAELKKNSDQPPLFEKFGQIVDRIFGTAGTFEMKELASYCGTLKKICYECAKAGNPRGNLRVLRLLEAYLENVNSLIKGISDPVIMKQLNFSLHLEEQKAKKIQEEILNIVKSRVRRDRRFGLLLDGSVLPVVVSG
jgi:hypothetical protein